MNELEVCQILSDWFEEKGYEVENEKPIWDGGPKIDIITKSSDRTWIVETKGDYDSNSAQYNVNFDTGMGQLLKSILRLEGKTKYGIAIPFSRTQAREKFSYKNILPKYSQSLVFEKLNIYLILICDDKSVDFIKPENVKGFLQEYFGDV